MDKNTFKDWLLPKLEEKNLTVAKLAYEMGVSRAIIYYYLQDVNRPTAANIDKMCSVLGADPYELKSLIVQRTNGRPVGSVKKWGAVETISKNNDPVSAEESISLQEV